MPSPTYSDLHRSTPLTNISVAFFQANQGKFKARSIFPSVGVQKKSDKFYTYNRGDLLRSQAQRRAPGAEATVGSYRISDDNYEAERWSLAKDIADPDRANADPQFDLDGEAVEFLTNNIEMGLEAEWVDGFFVSGQWDGASNGSDMTGQAAPASTASNFRQWNDSASTPIEDVEGELTAVESETGYRPNTLVLGARVKSALKNHPDIIDRVKYTQRGVIDDEVMASLFGVPRIITLNAARNSANEGAANPNVDFIAGKHALLAYVAPSPGLRTPSAGYSFVWTGAGIPLQGAAVKRYRLDRNESDRIEAETWVGFKKVSSALGAMFLSAVA